MEKRLYKSNKNKIITGTCGGIGEYFNLDPTIIRLIFICIVFAGGCGFLIYIIAALIIPKTPIDNFDNFDNMENANSNYQEKPNREKKFKKSDDDFDSYFKK